jgi:hypothetical protein
MHDVGEIEITPRTMKSAVVACKKGSPARCGCWLGMRRLFRLPSGDFRTLRASETPLEPPFQARSSMFKDF